MGAWSMPTNQMFGLALAALMVSLPRLKPVDTMMLKPCVMKLLRRLGYSEADFGTANGMSPLTPTSLAPACAPLYVYSLKFLSLMLPTSLTTPIFHFAAA